MLKDWNLKKFQNFLMKWCQSWKMHLGWPLGVVFYLARENIGKEKLSFSRNRTKGRICLFIFTYIDFINKWSIASHIFFFGVLCFWFLWQTGLMGKTLLEFQSNKGDVLPAHKVNLWYSHWYLIEFDCHLNFFFFSHLWYLSITQKDKKISLQLRTYIHYFLWQITIGTISNNVTLNEDEITRSLSPL